MNQFDNLDAQNEMSRFAQMTTEETAEFNAWLDECAAKWEAES